MNISSIIYYCHLIVLFHTIKMLVKIVICHEDMTGKRGENVAAISIFPFCIEFKYIGRKTPHYSIMMMSLHYVTNDIISFYRDYK